MAFYLSKQREEDVFGAYRRYQKYLHEHKDRFPASAFELGTAEWYQNANDPCCPHDARLESITISELSKGRNKCPTTIKIRLSAAHGHTLEFFYPEVFSYTITNPSADGGLGDWRYDEFRISEHGHLLHEIEWAGWPHGESSKWLIEASDVKFQTMEPETKNRVS